MEKKYLTSIDITRGLVVLLAVFATALPWGSYDLFKHADWYGLTLTDLVFPFFITIYGVGLALATFRRVNWKKAIRRTFVLFFLGILFNMVVDWTFDLSTLRITGVLQMFALLGILTILLTRVLKKISHIMLFALLLTTLYLFFLLGTSQGCEGNVPQLDCNMNFVIDQAVFGSEHLYRLGERGHDPEGLINIISAWSNVLFGFAAGRILLESSIKRKVGFIYLMGVGMVSMSLLYSYWIDFNKRIWSPSFVLLTSGLIMIVLATLYYLLDEKKVVSPKNLLIIYLISFGKNSLLVYFGKMIVLSLVGVVILSFIGIDLTISQALRRILEGNVPYPDVAYALVFVVFWSIITITLHWKKKYLKV